MNYDRNSQHADLARANVLRLRGEFTEAEALCVRVLEFDPNNADVHTLLGDIASTRDNIDQALEHYSLSLQLDPTSSDVARKLEEARTLKANRELAQTVEQIGLPPRSAFPWGTLAFAGFSLLCLAVVVGFALRHPSPNHSGGVPIVISAPADSILSPQNSKGDSDAQPASSAKPLADPKVPHPGETGAQGGTGVGVGEDRAIQQMLSERSNLGTRLQSVVQDPRTHQVTLTFSVSEGEDARRLGAQFARTLFEQINETQVVTVRAIQNGTLIFVADATRTRYLESIADLKKSATPERVDSLGDEIFSNEWPARPVDSTDEPTKGP
jgi:tetratricopeptide (TPR) repeat protein